MRWRVARIGQENLEIQHPPDSRLVTSHDSRLVGGGTDGLGVSTQIGLFVSITILRLWLPANQYARRSQRKTQRPGLPPTTTSHPRDDDVDDNAFQIHSLPPFLSVVKKDHLCLVPSPKSVVAQYHTTTVRFKKNCPSSAAIVPLLRFLLHWIIQEIAAAALLANVI